MTGADDDLVIFDRRQSPTAAAVQRGVCRMLRQAGFATLPEFSLASGRRADVIGIDVRGAIWIVEIKSSPVDFLTDRKWGDYRAYCDRLYFAIPPEMARELIPGETGLIVADAWGGEIVRHTGDLGLAPARRRAMLLRFARAAALRLHSHHDPNAV